MNILENSDRVPFGSAPELMDKLKRFHPMGHGDFHGPRYSRLAVEGLQLHLEVPWP